MLSKTVERERYDSALARGQRYYREVRQLEFERDQFLHLATVRWAELDLLRHLVADIVEAGCDSIEHARLIWGEELERRIRVLIPADMLPGDEGNWQRADGTR